MSTSATPSAGCSRSAEPVGLVSHVHDGPGAPARAVNSYRRTARASSARCRRDRTSSEIKQRPTARRSPSSQLYAADVDRLQLGIWSSGVGVRRGSGHRGRRGVGGSCCRPPTPGGNHVPGSHSGPQTLSTRHQSRSSPRHPRPGTGHQSTSSVRSQEMVDGPVPGDGRQ